MVTLPTAQIKNIVCTGHGSLCFGTASIVQHCATLVIVQDPTALYEEFGTRLESPITIFPQDPGYTVHDGEITSLFSVSIQILTDPGGSLAINKNSLVMSCYPRAPEG
jgi:energy-converting hydrogenase Eha subunit F